MELLPICSSSEPEEADPCILPGSSHTHQGPVEAAINSELCGISRQVSQGWLHVAPDINCTGTPPKWVLEPTQIVVGFRTYQSLTQLTTQVTHQKGDSSKEPDPAGNNSISVDSTTQQIIHYDWGLSLQSASPRVSLSHEQANILQANYNRRAHINYTRDILGASRSGDLKDCTTEPHKMSTTWNHHNKFESNNRLPNIQ